MIETLDKIITDEHLGWDKTLTDQKQQFIVQLDSKIIEDLIKRRNELDKLNEIDLPLLKNKILDFRKEILLDGVGLFIIDGACLKNFSLKEKISIYTLIAKILGELIIQNIQQEKIVEIKDVGKSMKNLSSKRSINAGDSISKLLDVNTKKTPESSSSINCNIVFTIVNTKNKLLCCIALADGKLKRQSNKYAEIARAIAISSPTLYPAFFIAVISDLLSISSVSVIRAVSEAKLTLAFSTPLTFESAFSTRLTQEAHVMPSIFNVTVSWNVPGVTRLLMLLDILLH